MIDVIASALALTPGGVGFKKLAEVALEAAEEAGMLPPSVAGKYHTSGTYIEDVHEWEQEKGGAREAK